MPDIAGHGCGPVQGAGAGRLLLWGFQRGARRLPLVVGMQRGRIDPLPSRNRQVPVRTVSPHMACTFQYFHNSTILGYFTQHCHGEPDRGCSRGVPRVLGSELVRQCHHVLPCDTGTLDMGVGVPASHCDEVSRGHRRSHRVPFGAVLAVPILLPPCRLLLGA